MLTKNGITWMDDFKDNAVYGRRVFERGVVGLVSEVGGCNMWNVAGSLNQV